LEQIIGSKQQKELFLIGKIASYNPRTASGVIAPEFGEHFDFDISGVLEYDVSALAIGQMVNFDLQNRTPRAAINISVLTTSALQHKPAGHREVASHRYAGFDQQGNVRAYHFQRMAAGEEKQTITVDIDLDLFKRHHVVIQEGPAICLRLLTAELDVVGEPASPLLARSVTEQYMLAYLASKPIPTKPGRRNAARASSLPSLPA